MLHVRLVSKADRTGQLVERLSALSGVQNLVVLAQAARRPDGDAVQFDVQDGAANPVFRDAARPWPRPRGPDLGGAGGRRPGQRHRPGWEDRLPDTEIAPVWEMVEATIRSGAVYPPSFFVLLTIAGLIGAAGILTNSQILIVGAMVVGPEYNAIIAVALGLSKRERGRYGPACSPCCGDSSPRW